MQLSRSIECPSIASKPSPGALQRALPEQLNGVKYLFAEGVLLPAKLFFFRPFSQQIIFARVEFDINMLAVRFGLSVGWLIARIVSAVKLHIA